MRFALLPSAALAFLAVVSGPALAHPHVWIKSTATLVFDGAGRVSAVRHGWTFDEAYSAYAVQGFEKGPDGKLAPDKMAELAKINMEALVENEFFTVAKANGAKLGQGAPVNYSTSFENGALTLSFELPLVADKPARLFVLEVYDPTSFVDFALVDGESAVRLENAPKGCALNVTRPKPPDPAENKGVSESFFSALTAASNYGAQFASRALVACP
jgi:ABC-type uncharacterized transport system substrate-binding protein